MHADVKELQILFMCVSFIVPPSLQRTCMLCRSVASHALDTRARPV